MDSVGEYISAQNVCPDKRRFISQLLSTNE